MKIDILKLFPHMFDGFLTENIMKKAIEKGKVEINKIDKQNREIHFHDIGVFL